MNMKLQLKHLLLSLLFLPFFACLNSENVQAPVAHQGVLDLSQWDFGRYGSVELRGEWDFYWQEFLPLEDVEHTKAERTLILPGYWNSTLINGEKVGGSGYATFSLRVLLPPWVSDIAIKTGDIQTAFELYANGVLLQKGGRIGRSVKSSLPFYQPGISSFHAEDNELLLVLYVSNFHHARGGAWEGISLGPKKVVKWAYDRSFILDLLFFCSILSIGLYLLLLFILNRSERSLLYFALFSICIALRSLTVGKCLAYIYLPEAGWAVLHRIEYISMFACIPLFFHYLDEIFKKKLPALFLKIIDLVIGGLTLFVIFAPSIIYTHILYFIQLLIFFSGIYSIFLLLNQGLQRDRRGFILLSGFLMLFFVVLNDILHADQIIHTVLLVPFGLFLFVISQVILIALNLREVQQQVEQQRLLLIKKNDSLLQEIHERKVLQKNLLETYNNYVLSRFALIMGLAKLAEFRDEDTGSHLERMSEYSRVLAERIIVLPEYCKLYNQEWVDEVYRSSVLHDIGKVGIPDSILLKEGPLSDEEMDIMREHPALGYRTLSQITHKVEVKSILTVAQEIAFSHHEKWDGSGYPEGLKGEDIPLSARIVALADVYDALTTERCYKKAFSHDAAYQLILEEKGRAFDPVIVDLFVDSIEEFLAISHTFRD